MVDATLACEGFRVSILASLWWQLKEGGSDLYAEERWAWHRALLSRHLMEVVMNDDDESAALAHQQELEHQEQIMNKQVYQAINNVQAALSHVGIGKDRKNEQQGYKFRGIDDVYNALAPALAANGLCILPRCTERIVTERLTQKGGVLIYVTVKVDFDFVSASDGSIHTVTAYGEAMDSGDKATNKSMSAAYKYACMQTFCIPTEGDNDADATTHTLVAAVISPEQVATIKALADEVGADMDAFLKYFDIERVEDMAEAQYDRAIAALKKKRKPAPQDA